MITNILVIENVVVCLLIMSDVLCVVHTSAIVLGAGADSRVVRLTHCHTKTPVMTEQPIPGRAHMLYLIWAGTY